MSIYSVSYECLHFEWKKLNWLSFIPFSFWFFFFVVTCEISMSLTMSDVNYNTFMMIEVSRCMAEQYACPYSLHANWTPHIPEKPHLSRDSVFLNSSIPSVYFDCTDWENNIENTVLKIVFTFKLKNFPIKVYYQVTFLFLQEKAWVKLDILSMDWIHPKIQKKVTCMFIFSSFPDRLQT